MVDSPASDVNTASETAEAPSDAGDAPIVDTDPQEPTDLLPAPDLPELRGRLSSGREVFAVLRQGFTKPACVAGHSNQKWRNRYTSNPKLLATKLESALPLLGYVTEQVRRQELPSELVLIPIIESWYEPDARGPGGPSGLWQMVSITAKDHGVPINAAYDGRFSVIDSTDAALSYLKHLSRRFDRDWRAMVMAYNAGEFRLLGAFKRNGSRKVSGEARLPKGLSTITYDYVDKLHALACLITEPEREGLRLPQSRFTPLSVVRIDDPIDDLRRLARRYGIAENTALDLNPAYRQGRIPSGAPRRALLPIAGRSQTGPVPSETVSVDATEPVSADGSHTVRAGDTLWRIASQYGIPLRRLLDLNRLHSSAVLRIGQIIRLK